MSKDIIIGICDDDITVHTTIENYCVRFFGNNKTIKYVRFFDGKDIIDYSKDINNYIHLLFLDIEMEQVDGFEVMKALMNNTRIWRIAFVSSHIENILETFSIKTIGFIPKPIEETRIIKVLNSIVEEYQENQELEVAVGNRIELIKFEDIVYLKADGSYTEIYTKTNDGIKEITMAKKLGDLEKVLDDKIFLRVHRSFIVNAEYVSNYKAAITLVGISADIPVGRKYKAAIVNNLRKYKSMRIGRRL